MKNTKNYKFSMCGILRDICPEKVECKDCPLFQKVEEYEKLSKKYCEEKGIAKKDDMFSL